MKLPILSYTEPIGNLILKNGKPEMYRFYGRYASFDADTINGCHYYIADYLGNNRMVVNASTDEVEQVNHYYAYGGIIGNLSSNESLQEFKFGDKKLDRTYGLDLYDFEVRQYDAITPWFTSIDPLAEDFTWLTPYNYCAGDPVNCVDPDGKAVKPIGNSSLDIIKNTLPQDAHQYVQLTSSGYIDSNFLNEYGGSSDNFQSLKTLVEASIDIEVTTSLQTQCIYNGNTITEDFSYYEIDEDFKDENFSSSTANTTGEIGNLGVTYMPTNGNLGKADAKNPNGIHININPQLTPMGAAEAFSHEAYGHALIYIESNGDRKRATHQFVGDKDINKELLEKSIRARKETVNNMQNK